MRVHADHGLLVGVGRAVQVLGSAAFFFLAVDKPLHLTRRPVAFVQVKLAQAAAHQPMLIIRIQNLKAARQPRQLVVIADQPMRESVKSSDPHAAHRKPQKILDAPAHLVGGLVGESDGQNGVGRNL